jgi:hypothetical protein
MKIYIYTQNEEDLISGSLMPSVGGIDEQMGDQTKSIVHDFC